MNLNAAQARKRAILDKDYKLQGVRARRRVGGAYEYLCVWEDFGPDGDTWEPFDHLGPHKKKVAALDRVVEVPFDRHRFLLQELIAKQLTSRKVSDRSAVYQKEMVVPFLVDIEVAEALLARMRRTRQGGALLPLTRKKGRVELQVDQLADLGSIINLQEHSLGKVGTCNLRINSGATSYTDMVMVIPSFVIGYRVRKQKGYELITFFYRYSTVVFNGKTGEPRFPAAPKGKGWTNEERKSIVGHAKRLLKQRWSPAPVDSHLRRKGWHLLPDGVEKLASSVAYS